MRRIWWRLSVALGGRQRAWRALEVSERLQARWELAGASAVDARAWRDSGCSLERAIGWVEAGFQPADRVPWQNAGFSDGAAAAVWRDANLSPALARVWSGRDFTAAESAEWVRHGFAVDGAALWCERWSPAEAAPWWKAGFDDADEAHAFWLRNFDPQAAASWRAADFTPAAASVWQNSGLEPREAKGWAETFGFPEQAQAWAGRGFLLEQAREWSKEDFDAAEAARWRDVGADVAKASRFRDEGRDAESTRLELDLRHSPALERLLDAGVAIGRVAAWRDLVGRHGLGYDQIEPLSGIADDPAVVEPWLELVGGDVDAAAEWSAVLSIEQARRWVGTSLAPAEAARWAPLCDDPALVEAAQRWVPVAVVEALAMVRADVFVVVELLAQAAVQEHASALMRSPLDSVALSRAGFVELGAVLLLLDAGVPHVDARRWRGLGAATAEEVVSLHGVWDLDRAVRFAPGFSGPVRAAPDWDAAFDGDVGAASIWFDTGLSSETAARLAGVGFEPSDASGDRHLSDDERVAVLLAWADRHGQDARKVMNAFRAREVDSLSAALAWCEVFRVAEALGWLDVEVRSVSGALDWSEAGHAPESAGPWLSAGVAAPAAVERLVERGIDVEHYRGWCSLGVRGVDDACRHLDAWSLDDAGWLARGPGLESDLERALVWWQAVEGDRELLEGWRASPRPDADAWVVARFRIEERDLAVELGGDHLGLVEFRDEVGPDWFPVLHSIVEAGVASLTAATEWVGAVGGQNASAWLSRGVASPEVAAGWGAEAWSDRRAVEWARLGVGPDEASAWEQQDLTPESAAEWMVAGVDDASEAGLYAVFSVPPAVVSARADRAGRQAAAAAFALDVIGGHLDGLDQERAVIDVEESSVSVAVDRLDRCVELCRAFSIERLGVEYGAPYLTEEMIEALPDARFVRGGGKAGFFVWARAGEWEFGSAEASAEVQVTGG